MKYTHKLFIKELKNEFPQITEELNDEVWRGLLHLEISCLARYTNKQIKNTNKEEFKRCISFITKIHSNCSSDITNAIYVSYLEHLEIKDDDWIYKIIPSEFKSVLNKLNHTQ